MSFFTVTGCGPRRGCPRVSRLIVSGRSHSSSFSLFVLAASAHRAGLPQEPRRRNGLGSGSVCWRRTDEDQTPSFNQQLTGLLLTWINECFNQKVLQHLSDFIVPASFSALLQRLLTPIAPYGEMFLYNNPDSTPVRQHRLPLARQ